jgi:hypothetical protein
MILILIYFFRSIGLFTRYKLASLRLQRKFKQQTFVVLYVNKVCLISKNINYLLLFLILNEIKIEFLINDIKYLFCRIVHYMVLEVNARVGLLLTTIITV